MSNSSEYLKDADELHKLLKSAGLPPANKRRSSRPYATESPIDDEWEEETTRGKLCQFTTGDHIRFFPAGKTVEALYSGIYDIMTSPSDGIYFQKIPVKTDDLIRFPETNSEIIISEIQKFWEREHLFKQYHLNYKRGLLLWGPPGSGKSCTIQLIVADVVSRQGVVFKFGSPGLFREGLRIFREIQPDTPVVVLMEDIDSTIETYSESDVLNILDGVDQFEKIVYLATTNYPERLGQRIMNRPSRFDKRFKMGHPKRASRMLYFKHLIKEDTIDEFKIDLEQWVGDTEGMSVAHLKELFINVCILGNDYDESILVLKKMVEDAPSSEDEGLGGMGFLPTKVGVDDD